MERNRIIFSTFVHRSYKVQIYGLQIQIYKCVTNTNI